MCRRPRFQRGRQRRRSSQGARRVKTDSLRDPEMKGSDHRLSGAAAKSEAKTAGELGAEDVRQAGSHLRYVSDKRDEAIPAGSISLIMSPQVRVHPAAHSIAETHTYLVRPDFVLDLFDRLIRSWRTLRARGANSLSPEDALVILRSHEALPSMWLPKATNQALARSQANGA